MLRTVTHCIYIYTYYLPPLVRTRRVEEWNVKGGGGTVLSFVLCQRLTPFTDDCMLVNTPENSEVNGISLVFVLVADTQGRCVTLVRDSITAVILYYFSR